MAVKRVTRRAGSTVVRVAARTTSVLALAVLAACEAEPPTVPEDVLVTPASAAVTADQVDDLTVVAATDSSVQLRWTQVSDGTGRPALYRLKYAKPSINWASATVGCNAKGSQIGAFLTCDVGGLEAATMYDFQLMSYRLAGGKWQGATYSNVATASTASSSAGAVADLSVESATDATLTVRWTQVDDGTGNPASYRVKYGTAPWSWSTGAIGCASTISGTSIGAPITCTIDGLAGGTTYEIQLMSFRIVDGTWHGAVYSNATTGTTMVTPTSGAAVGDRGIWADPVELKQLPMSGAAWDRLTADAGRDPGTANIADQDSNHDVYTLAAALVCVRANQYCAKARQGVLDAIGTESGARWLAVGRNLGAYVIAADLLDLRGDGVSTSAGTRVEGWIASWLTRRLQDNNTTDMRYVHPFGSSANASAQEGFAYAAVAAYMRDSAALDRAWDAFRTYACDPTAPDNESIYLDPPVRDGWTHDDRSPCAVNPAGTRKTVPSGLPGAGGTYRIDGAITGDMRRGGVYQWRPGYTSYPWVGLEGFVPAAVILERAGYPAFQVADRAVLRTHEYLWQLRNSTGEVRWFDGTRAREIVQLVNVVYGTSFPVNDVAGGGRTVGYTSWSHPRW